MTEHRLAGAPEQAEPSRRGRFWLALAVLAAVCGFATYRSSLFRLEQVQVTGLRRLSEARIMEVAGLAPGVSRWEHSAAAIRTALENEPWVKSVNRVAWNWGRLEIDLDEREPVGLIRYHDLYYLSLDASGLILEQTALEPGQALPVVSGVQLGKALRGQQVPHPGLGDALTVLAQMAVPLRQQVSEVQVDGDRSLTLFMNNGATVLWGQVPPDAHRSGEVGEKLKLFALYWQNVPRRRLPTCRIDLRVDGKAIPTDGCR